MKPFGYAVVMEVGFFVGIYQDEDTATKVCDRQIKGHKDIVVPVYTEEQMVKFVQEYSEQLTSDRSL